METKYKEKRYNARVEADISYDYYRDYQSRKDSYETERYARYDSRMSELFPNKTARDSYECPESLFFERPRNHYERHLEYYAEFHRNHYRNLFYAPSADHESVISRATEPGRAKHYENYYAENYNFHNTSYGSHVPHDRSYMAREIEHGIYGPNYSETMQSKAYRQASRYAYNDRLLAQIPRDYPVAHSSRDYVYDYPPARNQHNSFGNATVSNWHDYLSARNRYDYQSDRKQYDYPSAHNQYDYPAGHSRYKYEYEDNKHSNQYGYSRDYYYNNPRADSGYYYDGDGHRKKIVDCDYTYNMMKIKRKRKDMDHEEYTEDEDPISYKKSNFGNDLNAEGSESNSTRVYKKERIVTSAYSIPKKTKSDSSTEPKEATSYAKRSYFDYGSCSMRSSIDAKSKAEGLAVDGEPQGGYPTVFMGESFGRRLTSVKLYSRGSKNVDERESQAPCQKNAASCSVSSVKGNHTVESKCKPEKNTKGEDNMKCPGAINVSFNTSTNNDKMKVYPSKTIVEDEQKSGESGSSGSQSILGANFKGTGTPVECSTQTIKTEKDFGKDHASSAFISLKERKVHSDNADSESGWIRSVQGKAEHSKDYPTSSSWGGTSKLSTNLKREAGGPDQKNSSLTCAKEPNQQFKVEGVKKELIQTLKIEKGTGTDPVPECWPMYPASAAGYLVTDQKPH